MTSSIVDKSYYLYNYVIENVQHSDVINLKYAYYKDIKIDRTEYMHVLFQHLFTSLIRGSVSMWFSKSAFKFVKIIEEGGK